MDIDEIRMDKTRFSIVDLHDQSDDTAYWLTKTPQERLEALEYLRRINYGDSACARLQRIFEIAQRK
ncbi:MAG: hypothetical protein HQM10_17150 [Candidatus Riflebacteria bacterium]|nr:hypothetical protein [Candidatus Riflebacteria bacterium]